MCQLFINAHSELWSNKTKSLRIDGVVTSIRLEQFFWHTLEEIAARDNMSINQMICKLYRESLQAKHNVSNFTSFLRVCCSRYLALIANGEICRDLSQPLASVDVQQVLNREQSRYFSN